MMGEFSGFMMMAWMPLLVVFWIVVIAVVVWFIRRWLHGRQTLLYTSVPSQQRSYQSHEQGYQPPPQQAEGTYQEGGMPHSYPQPENEHL